MPVNTYKHVIVSADTRTTEFFMAVVSAVWSLWVLCADHNANINFETVMSKTGSFLVWGTWPAVNCIFQVFAIYYKYPRLRFVSASISSIYWICIAYTTFLLGPAMFTPYMATVYAITQLWILLHRTAAPLSE